MIEVTVKQETKQPEHPDYGKWCVRVTDRTDGGFVRRGAYYDTIEEANRVASLMQNIANLESSFEFLGVGEPIPYDLGTAGIGFDDDCTQEFHFFSHLGICTACGKVTRAARSLTA